MKENTRVLKNRIMIGAAALTAAAVPFAGLALTAGPAGAAKTKTITCTKMSGNTAKNLTLSGCNGNTGGKSKPFSAALLAGGGAITWANGKTTTFAAPTLGNGTNCKAGTATDVTATGVVTADTTKSAKPIPGTFNGEVCINGSGKASLPAGHPLTAN
jgi:hypothetical protein